MVVDDLTETICRLSPEGAFIYANEAYCRLFGKTYEELIGRPWQPVAVAEDVPMIEAKLRTLTAKNPVVVIETRVYDGTGRVRWMQFVNRGFFDGRGRLVETQSVGRDITDRVLAEQKLAESQERWRFALESSGFGVWDWDLVQDMVFRSSQFKAMLGYAANESIEGEERGWQETVHPDDLPGTEVAVNNHLAGNTAGFARTFRLRCKDGSWKWVLGRGRVISRDAEGRALRMIGTTADVSERKAGEEREAHNLKLVAEGAPCAEVLKAIVHSVEASFPGMLCSVMLANAAGTSLHLEVAPSLPEYVRKAVDGMPIGPGIACCGAAVHSGQRVIYYDVLAEAHMEPFHKLSLKAKLRACWSQPIVSVYGKVLGAFACYRREPHAPDTREIQTVTTAARLAAVAIEREKREQQLTLSEDRHTRAMHGVSDGLWDWNLVTGEIYRSTRWNQMLGFQEGELKGDDKVFLSRLHPEDVERVEAARQAHFDRREPYRVEFRLKTKVGDYLWFLARGQAEWDAQGKPVRMTGTITDITARKVVEQALEESERKFRAVFEQAAVGVAVIDTCTGRFMSVNQRMCEIVRRPESKLLKLTFMEVTCPEDLQEDLNQMEALKTGHISSFIMEKRYVLPDRSLIWVDLTVSRMWQPGEPPLRHIAVVNDITQRKQAELNYRREMDYNMALVSHTSAFIWVLDAEGRMVHANAAFFATMGYAETEIIGKTLWETGIMAADEIVRSKQRFARLLRGEKNPPTDVRLRTKSGEWRSIDLRSTFTRNPDGGIDRLVGTGTDVTERNRLQQELLRVVEQEQARVGHDLHDGVGQTMTGIVIMMEALEAELQGAAQEQVRRIRELVQESVAEVRRMSHGLSPTGVKYRGLGGALQLLAETVRTNFRTPCTCEVDDRIMIGDEVKETHLFRIAQEAVNNALRHGKPQRVTIQLQQVGAGECELRVEDDGGGLKAAKAKEHAGIGVRVMDYRANLIGGALAVAARPRRGVRVTCRFPYPASA